MGADYSWHFSDWESALGMPPEFLIDDLTGNNELKFSPKLYKTDEEISKLMIDETMSQVEKAFHILKNGLPLQKVSIISNLVVLLEEHPRDRESLLGLILSSLTTMPLDLKIKVGIVLQEALVKKLIDRKECDRIANLSYGILDNGEQDICSVYSDVIIAAIPFISMELLEKKVLPQAMKDGEITQPSPCRVWCCRVLGALAPRFEPSRVKELFLNKALLLCQDTDYEVRINMCNQLNSIARVVANPTLTSDIVDEYVELLLDEEDGVRISAIRNVSEIEDILDNELKRTMIVPIWKKFCLEKNDNIINFTSTDIGLFLWKFNRLVFAGTEEQMINCAYNYPGLLKSFSLQEIEKYGLHQLLEVFSRNRIAEVRRRIACGLHQVSAILGSGSYRYVKDTMINLLQDDDLSVQESLYSNIDNILNACITDDIRQHTDTTDILFSLLRKERDCALGSWRLHQLFLEQFTHFYKFFDSDQIQEHCIPLLLKNLGERRSFGPIISTIISVLCNFLRNMKAVEAQEKIHKTMNQEFAHSSTYRRRIIFLDFTQHIMDQFSNRYFKEHYFNDLIELSKDPISNVRLKVCRLLPLAKNTLRMPIDSGLMQKLNEAIGNLLIDSVLDVSQEANRIISEMGSSGPRIFIGNSQFDNIVEEIDHQKEMEEYKETDVYRQKRDEEGIASNTKGSKKARRKQGEADTTSKKAITLANPTSHDKSIPTMKSGEIHRITKLSSKMEAISLDTSATTEKKEKIRVKMPAASSTTAEQPTRKIGLAPKKEITSTTEKDDSKKPNSPVPIPSKAVKAISKQSKVTL